MTKISAQELLAQIRELESYFKKHKNKTNISRIKDLDEVKQNLENKDYNIAIVANMSAGKSTFINALFGEEILPSSHLATTDCATYIHCNKRGGGASMEIEELSSTSKMTKKKKNA